MKKVLILVLVVLCVAAGCQKKAPPENWSEYDISTLKVKATKSPWLLENFDFEAVQIGDIDRLIDVADVSQMHILLVKNPWGDFQFVEYDRLSMKSVREVSFSSYDMYFGTYKIKGISYTVLGRSQWDHLNNTPSTQVVILDVWNKEKVAEFTGEGSIFTAQTERAIILCDALRTGTKNAIYRFENQQLTLEKEYTFEKLEDERLQGDVITGMCADQDAVWIQRRHCENQWLPDGIVTIENYQAKQKIVDAKADVLETELILKNAYTTDAPFLSMFTGNQCVIGSVYGQDESAEYDGLLVVPQEKAQFVLPGVQSGKSISYAAAWKDGYVYAVYDGVYYFHGETKEVELLYAVQNHQYKVVAHDDILAIQDGVNIVLLQSNAPKIIGDIDSAVVENLQTALNLPDVEQLYETENCMYYLESSSYAHRQYQGADGIIWEYDKKTEQCKKMEEFFYIFSSNEVEVDKAAKTFTYVLGDPKDKSNDIVVPFR